MHSPNLSPYAAHCYLSALFLSPLRNSPTSFLPTIRMRLTYTTRPCCYGRSFFLLYSWLVSTTSPTKITASILLKAVRVSSLVLFPFHGARNFFGELSPPLSYSSPTSLFFHLACPNLFLVLAIPSTPTSTQFLCCVASINGNVLHPEGFH